MRRRQSLALSLLAVLLCGCGPTLAISADWKQSDANLVLGQRPVTSSPVPVPSAVNPFPNFPAPIEMPPPPAVQLIVPPASTPFACPDAPPGAAAEPAVATPRQAPVPGTYPFRYSGTRTLSTATGALLTATPLPQTGTRAIENVTPPAANGDYTFTVDEQYNGADQKDSYHVYPNGPTPTIQDQPVAAGIYLTSLVITGGPYQESFTPAQPGVLVMPLPGADNTKFASDGTDPITGTSWESEPNNTTVTQETTVNACGHPIDTWAVTIAGHMVSSAAAPVTKPTNGDSETTFTLTLHFATQFGGFSIADSLVQSGIDAQSGDSYTYNLQATINVVPHAPAGQ